MLVVDAAGRDLQIVGQDLQSRPHKQDNLNRYYNSFFSTGVLSPQCGETIQQSAKSCLFYLSFLQFISNIN